MEDYNMAYRKVDSEFKFDVIKDLWSGLNYTQLSKKHGIPRATIYNWEQTAKDAIIDAFNSKTPGKRTVDVKEENQKLKDQLLILYHDKHKTAQDESIDKQPPLICTKCGNSHLKKNGTVLTKKDGLRQRYNCLDCSLSIYIEIKKNQSPVK